MAPDDSDKKQSKRKRRSVLDPNDLDISRRREVAEIDEGRYVVSPSGTPRVDPDALEKQDWLQRDDDEDADEQAPQPQPNTTQTAQPQPEPQPTDTPTPDRSTPNKPPEPSGNISANDVSQWLAKSFAKNRGQYGYDLTIDMEGNVKRTRAASNDIGNTLESMLLWYADQATDELPPERVIGILLASMDTEVDYPVQSVYGMLKTYGLTPDDSIADLLTAVRQEGSFTVPPSRKD